jgi:hypothetical protein
MKRMLCCQLTVKDIATMLSERGIIKADEVPNIKMSSPSYGEQSIANQDTVMVEIRWEDR